MSPVLPVTLSHRGQKALLAGAQAAKIAEILGNQYSKENHDGIINFGVAENTLMQDDLLEYFNDNLKLEGMDLTYGDSVAGSKRLFSALSRFFGRYFKPVLPVTGEHIIAGGGLTALMDQLVQLLCDPGDVILAARPYYNADIDLIGGFDGDTTTQSQGIMYGVDIGQADPAGPSSLAAFEKAITILKEDGRTPRAVMLCNPHNPLGFNYARDAMLDYCRFCEKHELHLICDEVYALSQFGGEDARPFTSILSINVQKEAGCNPGRVHLMYGMSKDFCANGLRVGVIVSQHNKDLRRALYALSRFSEVSSASDALWSQLLLDDEKLDHFILTNQQRLADTCKYCCAWFESQGVAYVEPSAGHFILVNLGAFLSARNDAAHDLRTPIERDRDIFMDLIKAGIFVSLGESFHYTEHGWFRFTFSLRRDVLIVGLARLAKFLAARRT